MRRLRRLVLDLEEASMSFIFLALAVRTTAPANVYE